MWNDDRSVVLSKLGILFFMVALVGVALSAPWLVRWLVGFSRAELQGTEGYFLTTIYTGMIPAAMLLYSLYRLLQRIAEEQVFIPENVDHLRRISWSSIAGAAISLVSTLYYFPWFLVAVAAAFMALIVRVVKNVVAQAVSLQDEVDHTI